CMTPAASAGLDDLAALDATRADVHPLRGTADEGLHTLDVRVPTTLVAPVRVRHVHAPAWALAAHFTYCCHDGFFLDEIKRAWRCYQRKRLVNTSVSVSPRLPSALAPSLSACPHWNCSAPRRCAAR